MASNAHTPTKILWTCDTNLNQLLCYIVIPLEVDFRFIYLIICTWNDD